jgi:hypothetical protein
LQLVNPEATPFELLTKLQLIWQAAPVQE